MMVAIRSYETLVLTRFIRRHIPGDGNLGGGGGNEVEFLHNRRRIKTKLKYNSAWLLASTSTHIVTINPTLDKIRTLRHKTHFHHAGWKKTQWNYGAFLVRLYSGHHVPACKSRAISPTSVMQTQIYRRIDTWCLWTIISQMKHNII
jgi:hypothetical protein